MESLKAIVSTGNIGEEYLRGEKLGQGSFGCVYKGTTHDGKNKVAVKVIDHACQRQKLVLQEVKNLKRSHHPNIVRFLDCYLQKTSFYIVMEYIEGVTARHCKDYFHPPHIATVCKSVLQALDCLHEKSIVHMDVRGMNIMVSSQTGVVKLVDFGISTDESDHFHMKVGSLYYRAPELVTNFSDAYITHKVDIWSLGITMVELTNNKPYRDCRNNVEVTDRIKQMCPPEIPQGLPEPMRHFMQQCFIIDSWERPAAHILNHHDFLKRAASNREMSRLVKIIMCKRNT